MRMVFPIRPKYKLKNLKNVDNFMQTLKRRVVIATGNAGKVKEFTKILGETHFEFLTLKDIAFFEDIVEDGESFDANARIKAQAIADYLRSKGLDYPVLADDSGLEVQALGGAPGIYTARYAGIGATDQQNYEKLLRDLEGQEDRSARFVCCLCWLDGPHTMVFVGDCAGRILHEPRGTDGFGYDPVFEPLGHLRSFGEMSHEEKKALSHRGAAIHALRTWWEAH